MKLKTILMLSLFVGPFVILYTGVIEQVGMVFLLYLISGLGMAGIGMSVMHDALHGSYSKNKRLNAFLGGTMNLIGASAYVWHIQHNVLHHTYTNIHEADDDINMPFFLRFTPEAPKHKLHKYQFLYVWFFYAISTLLWVTIKDFVRIRRYRKLGLIEEHHEYQREMAKLIGWKILYYILVLVLPIVLLPVATGWVFLAFLAMHIFTGLVVSMVFQVAHIMTMVHYPKADQEGNIENNWTVHQFHTTCNFSPRSKVFSWLIGGLNYQIEHHLFPHICHVHYRKISPIVKATAEAHNIPYHVKPSFFHAVSDHVKMLKQLGK